MLKKVLIILGFITVFVFGIWCMTALQKRVLPEEVVVAEVNQNESNLEAYEDQKVYRYRAEDLQSDCLIDDEVFCAVERTVKCTISPELEACDVAYVPSFVLGKSDDVERPTEISFKIIKIKPIAESTDVSVYTESECNAKWFGLCQGTVVYSLSMKGEQWAVTNIFAME